MKKPDFYTSRSKKRLFDLIFENEFKLKNIHRAEFFQFQSVFDRSAIGQNAGLLDMYQLLLYALYCIFFDTIGLLYKYVLLVD